EDLLGLRVRVDVCGVERRDAGVERRVDARRRDVVLDLGAVGEPVAVGDLGDLETRVAEVAVVDHGLNLTAGRLPQEPLRVTPGRRRASCASAWAGAPGAAGTPA